MRTLFYIVIVIWPFSTNAAGERIDVARFSQGDISGWQTKVFAGETYYSIDKSNGTFSLRADSNAAASARYREINIDMSTTPILNWSWKVNNILPNIDEHTRGGDDYPARIYVVFSCGIAFWRTRAINYVWSSNQPVDTSWSNAFTKNVQMIAVKSGTGQLGQWVSEKRNVASDYQRLFGEKPRNISAIAIMTDTDNTNSQATAWYGDIMFTSK